MNTPEPATAEAPKATIAKPEEDCREAKHIALKRITSALAELPPKEAKSVLAALSALYAE